MSSASPKLLDQVREALRLKHYSYRTEQAYLQWIKRFILFHHKRHPADMGADESGLQNIRVGKAGGSLPSNDHTSAHKERASF